MRRMNSAVQTRFISEKGSDKTGKTYFAYVPLEQMACYAVAESYDSDTDINSAKLAVESVLVAFERNPSFRALNRYIQYAHDQIVLHSVKNKLEVAVTVVVTDYTRIRYACCGNIKFFVLSENSFYVQSETQTYYQHASKQYGADKVSPSENKNLLQYLGKKGRPKPYISKKILLPEACTMLFATCNLWEKVDNIEFLDAYESAKPDEFIANVQELYLSTQFKDPIKSYTLASMFVEKTFKEDTAKIKKRRFWIVFALSVILLLAIILTVVVLFMRANDRRAMAEIAEIDRIGIRYSQSGNYMRAFDQYTLAGENANNLNMRNWQFIGEKKELLDSVQLRLYVFECIQDGDASMGSGKYELAKTSYESAFSAARTVPELMLTDMLSDKLEMMRQYQYIENLILTGEMYDNVEMYNNALVSYMQADEIAKTLNDFNMRNELLGRIFNVRKKTQDKVEETAQQKADTQLTVEELEKQAEWDEKFKESELHKIAALEARLAGNNAEAMREYQMVLDIYRELEIIDDRYADILNKMAEIERGEGAADNG